MQLTPEQKEYLLSLIESRYPDWQGVSDPRFERDESSYKRKAEARAKEELSREYLEGALSRGEFEEIVTRIRKVGETSQMLYVSTPSTGDVGILLAPTLDKERFSRAVFELLYGDDDSSERLGKYSSILEEHGWPSTWPLPTLLLSLLHPEEDFMVKPTRLDWIMEHLDPTFRRPTKPTAGSYARIKEMGRAVVDAFADKGAVDMIDAHSIVWAAMEGTRGVAAKETVDWIPAPAQAKPVRSDSCPFSETTFELLRGIAADPTVRYYDENKAAFKSEVEEPFQRIMRQVADLLDDRIKAMMETKTGIFSRFRKNDFGQGGTWAHYWGAFYPKGSRRSEDAQLSIYINAEAYEFGFYIGNYGSEQRKRFLRNMEEHGKVIAEAMSQLVPAENVRFGGTRHVSAAEAEANLGATWQNFVNDPGKYECDVSYSLSPDELLATGEEELVEMVLRAHERLYPLVLLATHDAPLGLILDYLGEGPGPEDPEVEVYEMKDFLSETCLSAEAANTLVRLLEDKKQLLLYGPPGTGKTYVAKRLAQLLTGLRHPHGRVEVVQFHPSYGYEDFVEGIRPISKPGPNGTNVIDYPAKAGIFKAFCARALGTPGKCVFLVDEVNRGNVARIFGELLYLLEYRGEEVVLPYSQEPFRIPPNVYIIGTMNTADRSIALVDFALRRRFHAFRFGADVELLRRWLEQHHTSVPYALPLYEALTNEAIEDPNMKIGPSHFMQEGMTEDDLRLVWDHSILPYIEEYYFEDSNQVRKWLWEGERVKAIRSRFSTEEA